MKNKMMRALLAFSVAVSLTACGVNQDQFAAEHVIKEETKEESGQETVIEGATYISLSEEEITVDGEPMVFQFHDEDIAEQLEIMETDTAIQFDVETDDETGVKTIVKLYESAE